MKYWRGFTMGKTPDWVLGLREEIRNGNYFIDDNGALATFTKDIFHEKFKILDGENCCLREEKEE